MSRIPIATCKACGASMTNEVFAYSGNAPGKFEKAPARWLKRIPPLGELEGVKDAADVGAALGNINRKMREFLGS